MKTSRFEFHKGINVVGDKAVIEPGFATIMDNVDLRSGQPRALRAPELQADITVPAGTTRIYSYRGKWHFSPKYRDYVSTVLGGRERVMFTEEGGYAQKIIEGTQVRLGTPAPKVAPFVAAAGTTTPSITLTLTGSGGSIAKNNICSYRVGAETSEGILPASAASSVTTTVDLSSVKLDWSPVKGTIRYHIYKGAGSDEKEIAVTASNIFSFTDAGTGYSYGQAASEYDSTSPYTYFYTFVREVQTVADESGPSQLSASLSSSTGRTVVFDPVSDGFLTQTTTTTISSGITCTNSTGLSTAVVLTKAEYDYMQNQTKFTTATDHGFANDELKRFLGFGSQDWNNKDFKIVIDQTDTKVFYVRDMIAPSEAMDSSHTVVAAVTKITFSTAPGIIDGDCLWMNISDGASVKGDALYKCKKIDSTNYTIPIYTSDTVTVPSITFTPNNGFYKYRNLYRTGDSSGWLLVSQIEIDTLNYTDSKPAIALGASPDSYYTIDGTTVIYQEPPLGMRELTEHYGMLFAIDGHKVRWTPADRPDAWPETFRYNFAYQPVALASFAGALIVLAEDGLYRIDGNVPTQLSLNKTKAENGCIAHKSVQKTHAGLVYLSKRGIMLFDGMTAACISDQRLPYLFFSGSSSVSSEQAFWWLPTLKTYNYFNLSVLDGILGSTNSGTDIIQTRGTGYQIDAIRSAYHNGKYYIYWSRSDSNYPSNTGLCVDLQMPGMPITTLGFKPIDMHVDDTDNVFCLFNYSSSSRSDHDAFCSGQSRFATSFTWSGASSTSLGLYAFGTDPDYLMPYYIRTGAQAFGDPVERKRFKQVEFHSDGPSTGTIACRVWIDGRYVCDGIMSPTETPNKIRKINLPRGMNTGYTIDVEIAGNVQFRALEFGYEPMERTS